MSNTNTLTMDELFAVGEMEQFLSTAKKKCEAKVYGKTFAGMEKEDVVQEMLVKVYRSMDKYDSSVAKVTTFVDHIMENVLRDCYKKCMSEKNLAVVNANELATHYDTDEESSISSTTEVGEIDPGFENAEFITDFMEKLELSDREKEVFRLRSSGYEFQEIANLLGVSKARMSQIWSGIKKKYETM